MKAKVRLEYLQQVKDNIEFRKKIIEVSKQSYKETKDEFFKQQVKTSREILNRLQRKYLSLQARYAKQ